MFFLMKWREKWSEKWSEISYRAGGSPDPFFSSGRRPYIQVGTAQQSHALHWGIPPDPVFHQGVALCSFRKEPKGSVLFFGAKKRTKRSIHPNQAFPYMGRM